jgi:hypothetical protein
VLFDKVIRRFDAGSTDSNPVCLFNYQPQSFTLEQACKGAYFFGNVAPSGLPLVAESSQVRACKRRAELTPAHKPTAEAVGHLTSSIIS